jgi:hypothetical protein
MLQRYTIPGGHGFNMGLNKSILRSPILELQQFKFLMGMVSIWIITIPRGDLPILPFSIVSWQTWFAYGF